MTEAQDKSTATSTSDGSTANTISSDNVLSDEVQNLDALSVFRVVTFGLLASLLWRVNYFYLASQAYFSMPIEDTFFPYLLRIAPVSFAAYLTAVTCLILNFVTRQRTRLRVQTVITWLSISVLCLHQHSFNDMIFHATWWTSVWSVWMVWQITKPTCDSLLERAAFLSHVILSIIFLGAGIGKVTGGYWSGEVLYQIFFADRDYWFFNLLREWLDEPSLREFARWYSRLVVVSEVGCCTLWLLPQRLASWLVMPVLFGIALFSSSYLFSVVACLLCLALVGLHTPKEPVNEQELF